MTALCMFSNTVRIWNFISEIEHEDGTKLRTTPVAANGRLYYMSESPTKLWAIEAETNSN